jgi:hypothetical protein
MAARPQAIGAARVPVEMLGVGGKLWTKVGLSKRAIAAQAGWEESTVDKMLKVYGHGEVGALDEIDAAFAEHVPALRALKGGKAS